MPDQALSLDLLLALENQGWDSLCRSEGGTFYGRLMGPEAVMVLVNGMVLDRATITETLNDSPPWSSYEIDEPRLVPTGVDSAALVYTATAHRDGQDEPFVALMTSHYALADRRATLMLYQQTTITH